MGKHNHSTQDAGLSAGSSGRSNSGRRGVSASYTQQDTSSAPTEAAGAAAQQNQCVLELRVHYAEHMPRPLAGVVVEIRLGKEMHRSQPVSVDEGVAPFNSWGRLPCPAGDQVVHLRVMERYSSRAYFWLAPVSMATRHGTLSLSQLPDVEASSGTWSELSIELHSRRSNTYESLQAWAHGRGGWLPRRASLQQQQPVQLAMEARLVWQPPAAPVMQAQAVSASLPARPSSSIPSAAAAAAAADGMLLPEMALGCGLQRAAHIYGHGGFMGMALSLLHDTTWAAILQALDPKLFDDARLLLKLGHVPGEQVSVRLKLMTLLENSPVCCAYGLVRSGCTTAIQAAAPSSLMHTSIAEAEDEHGSLQLRHHTTSDATTAAFSSQQGEDPSGPSYDPEASSAARALEASYAGPEWQQVSTGTLSSSSIGSAAAGSGGGAQMGRPLSGIMPTRWRQLMHMSGQQLAAPGAHSIPGSPFAAAATTEGMAEEAGDAASGDATQTQSQVELAGLSTGPGKADSSSLKQGLSAPASEAGPPDMARSASGTELLRLNSSTQAFMRLNHLSMRRIIGSRLAGAGASNSSSSGVAGVGSAGAAVRWVDVARVRAQSGGQSIRMLAMAHGVNGFGYRPIGLEWDIWLSPERPWDISAAKVDHGTAGQLVVQAITTGVGLKRLAKKVGESQLRKNGTAPDQWLNMFGRALNLGLNGDEGVPLALQDSQLDSFYELVVEELEVEGLGSRSATIYNIKAEVHGNGHRVAPHHLASLTPDPHTGSVAWSPQLSAQHNLLHSSGGGAGPGAGLSRRKAVQLPESVTFWPLVQKLEGSELLIELFSKRKRLLGVARLPLQELTQAADAISVELCASLDPPAEAGRLFHHHRVQPDSAGTGNARWKDQLSPRSSRRPSSHVPDRKQQLQRHHQQDGWPVVQAGAGVETLEAPQQMAAPRRSGVPAADDVVAAVHTLQDPHSPPQPNEQAAAPLPADNSLADDTGGYGVWEDLLGPRGGDAGTSTAPLSLHLHTTLSQGTGTPRGAANGDMYEVDGVGDDDAATVAGSAVGLLCDGAVVRVKLRLRRVCVLQAAQERLGLPEAAARSCIAMLSAAGGLFLDVKSAYSKPRDLEQFCAALSGVGVHVKAVCSFSPKQLAFPSRGGPAPRWDSVRFFHGLNGLENACLDGNVPRGQAVLFNGASLLLGDAGMSHDEGGKAAGGAGAGGGLAGYRVVDEVAWLRYRAVVDEYDVAGGIYVQEPDAGPASVHALVRLVNDNPAYLPLGFAYGHLGDTTLPLFELNGKGFAAQSIIEELHARRALSAKAKEAIRQGKHRSASRFVSVAYGRRLLAANRLLRWSDQATFLYLLGDFQPAAELPRVVDEMGGIQYIFMRFWKQYDEFSPLTLLEQGFNLNETKSLLRMLRNRGVLAALPLDEKAQLGMWLAGRALYGSATWLLQWVGLRQGLHKLGKEALVCLLESCTKEEFDMVVAAVTNNRPEKLWLKLRGWTYILSWSFMARVHGVMASHKLQPEELAYLNDGYGYKEYSRVPLEGLDPDKRPNHTRDKRWHISTWRLLRKSTCCLVTVSYNCCLCCTTLGLWNLCCIPRLLRPYCANIWIPLIGSLVLTAFILMADVLIITVVITIVRISKGQGLRPGCSLSLDNAAFNAYSCNGTTIALLFPNGTASWVSNGSCLTANDYTWLFPGVPEVLAELPANGTACFVDA